MKIDFAFIAKTAIVFLAMLIIVNFVFDVGSTVFKGGDFNESLETWKNTIKTPQKIGIFVLFSIFYSIYKAFRLGKLKK